MNDIQFGLLSAYNDLHLILTNKTIASPSVKTTTIEVLGRDGVLDYTEYFGEINYNNRRLTFEFSTILRHDEFLNLFSYIQNTLHGKKMEIYLSDDPDFYYYGRINVNEWKSDKRIGKVTIEVDAEPYKYKMSTTTISRTITAATDIICSNLRKSVTPTITVTGEVMINFGTYFVAVSNTTYIDDMIVLKEGLNTLTVAPLSGSATIKIEYQERGL